jgi:hypothetical protein
MPIVVPNEHGMTGLYETSYSIKWAPNIEELAHDVSELLKHNLDPNSVYITSIKGGPVYEPNTKRWYQAYVSHYVRHRDY